MEECFTFQWEEGSSFLDGGFIFKEGVHPMGGIGFDGEFSKRSYFTTSYSIPFLSILHQNKALHTFHKRRQYRIARHIKGVE